MWKWSTSNQCGQWKNLLCNIAPSKFLLFFCHFFMLTNIIIFMSGNHFLILGRQMVTLKKIELGALHYHVYANNNKIINTMALIVLHTDSKNALCQTRPPAWLRQSLLLTQRLCMGCIYHIVEAEKCFNS